VSNTGHEENLKSNWLYTLYSVAGLSLLVLLVYFIRDVSTPFLVSLILAYAFDPAVDWFEEKGLSRVFGIAIVFTVIAGFFVFTIAFLIPLIFSELSALALKLPGYWEVLTERTRTLLNDERLANMLAQLRENHPNLFEDMSGRFSEVLSKILEPLYLFAKGAFSSLLGLVLRIIELVLIPVFTFYLLKDIDAIKRWFADLIPPARNQTPLRLLGEVDRVLSSFLRGQLTVCIILAVLYSTGLSVIGVPAGLVIGLLAGLANIVPYLGVIIGAVPALALTLMEYGPDWQILAVIGVFALVQALEGNQITPRIVGKSVGLNPVGVLLAVLAGGRYFGMVGIILAVPVTAALKVFAREAYERYRLTPYYLGGGSSPATGGASSPGPLEGRDASSPDLGGENPGVGGGTNKEVTAPGNGMVVLGMVCAHTCRR